MTNQTAAISDVRLIALARAQLTRRRRPIVKAQLRAGTITLREAIDDPAVASMQLGDLLRAFPQVGPAKARKVCHDVGVGTHKRVDALTERQVILLDSAARLRGIGDA